MWVEEKIDVDNIQFNECLDSLCGGKWNFHINLIVC